MRRRLMRCPTVVLRRRHEASGWHVWHRASETVPEGPVPSSSSMASRAKIQSSWLDVSRLLLLAIGRPCLAVNLPMAFLIAIKTSHFGIGLPFGSLLPSFTFAFIIAAFLAIALVLAISFAPALVLAAALALAFLHCTDIHRSWPRRKRVSRLENAAYFFTYQLIGRQACCVQYKMGS